MAETENHPVVRLENVVKIYRPPGGGVAVHALRGVSLTIHPAEFVAVMGPSGSGKTTLMNILGCLDRPTSGRYWLDGQDVSALGDDQLSDVRGRRIGFVFQTFNLISSQTVLENLETPLFYQDVPARERRRRAMEMAERVGIADRLHHLPHELSGGQQQRVAIGRALMNDPAMILADEPTGNLDSQSGQSIMELLTGLNAAGRTVIVVTHDPAIAQYCKRVVQIRDGLITSDGL